MKSKITNSNTSKSKQLNDAKIEELFHKMSSLYKKESDEKLYWVDSQ